ncbi:TetR family transcriptional regulator [Brucella pseudogrignonensis]|uniref:TetR family transcriptional regulator n=1 Tax=Brucella pseudogrignonensis TaxID=419475 RepID=UPI003ED0CD7B
MVDKRVKNKPAHKRDAEHSKRRILDAALHEFAAYGFAGARVDRIAEQASVSKPMLYEYFGGKNEVYSAALWEAYTRIREAEKQLDLDSLHPKEAVRELVHFTMNHFRSNPWFVQLLAIENLRGGETVRSLAGIPRIQSLLVERIHDLLERGVRAGEFRKGIDPTEFYVSIASLCYFPISNRHTLRAVFGLSIDDDWLNRHCEEASHMLLSYLKL